MSYFYREMATATLQTIDPALEATMKEENEKMLKQFDATIKDAEQNLGLLIIFLSLFYTLQVKVKYATPGSRRPNIYAQSAIKKDVWQHSARHMRKPWVLAIVSTWCYNKYVLQCSTMIINWCNKIWRVSKN